MNVKQLKRHQRRPGETAQVRYEAPTVTPYRVQK